MKILCLHGMGCSGTIFKAQTTAIRRLLGGDQHEFVFLDGEVECEPAPGIADLAPPPYLCYYKDVSIAEVADAHDQVQAAIEEDGPFDGVMAFSQGSALAVSLLLHHELNTPETKPPFNFAILFSGTMCLSPDVSLYMDFIERFMDASMGREDAGAPNHAQSTASSNDSTNGTDTSGSASPAHGNGKELDVDTILEAAAELRDALEIGPMKDFKSDHTAPGAFDADPLSEQSVRPYHPMLIKQRVRIPTLHVQGTADEWAPQSDLMYALCSEKERNLVKHAGGHDVPRDAEGLASMERFGKQVMERGRLVESGVL